MTVCISDTEFFELKIHRKQIKYAYIRVKPNRVLEISVPMKMPYDIVTELIKQKSSWIISVSKTLEDNYKEDGIKMMPMSKEQLAEIKYLAEDMAYDAVERIYPLVKPFGVNIPDVRVRYMTTRWGSCIVNKDKIWLNAYLAKLPGQCMDYVVLHEMIHFIHPNHSKDFYAMLDSLMPDWKKRRDILGKVQLPPRNAAEKASKI